jgi:Carboxypeptidase regulatory-like domain/PEGA domain
MSADDTPPPEVADLRVEPVEVTPGILVDVPVQVTNRADGPCTFTLEVVGIEPDWVELSAPLGPLAPGATGEATLRIQLPIGHPASRLVAAVTARSTARFFDQAAPDRELRDARADLVLVVGDGSLIGAVLEPPEIRGAHRAHLDVVLHNRSKAPQRVDLRATVVDPGVTVEFRDRSHVLAPGEEVRVRTRLHGPRPFIGAARRRPFGVRVQGRGTPVVLEGSFTQRPVLSGWLTKTVAIVAVVALWVTVAAVGITALDNHLHKSATAKSVAGAPPAPVPSIPGSGGTATTKPGSSPTTAGKSAGKSGDGSTATTTAKAPGAKTGSGAAGSSGSGAAAGGSGSGGSASSGSGGSSSGGSSGAGSSGAASNGGASSGAASSGGGSKGASGAGAATPPKGARVSGKLTGTQPGGVTVSISPTSLVDENTQGAAMTTSSVSGSGATEEAKISSSAANTPIGKVYGEAASASFDTRLTAATTPQQTTTTAPDGSWAFAGLRAPGDYLVTFSRDGYQTAKYIVTTTTDTSPVSLAASLSPGTGSISGLVNGSSGPLGDADITITDGRITAATKTPTVGATGTWEVSGLSTPDTYLVTAKAPGYAAQTTLVTLAAGGKKKDVALTLSAGEGTITGTVTTAANGSGVGGIKVTASSGKTSLSATTTTVSPIGSYSLPNLAIPGTYTLTVSGPGWVTQTQQVHLTGNPVVNAVLTPTAGDVNGVASSSQGGGLAGAGAILADDKNTFKTLTESAAPVGGFDFGQIPAGQYVLTIEDFGYTTTSAQVTVTDGNTQTVNLTLPFVGATNQDTATVQGSVSDVLNATAIAGATITLDGNSKVVATTGTDGTYQIPNVAPGVHTVTATAKGFESGSVQVSVSLGGVAFAPQIGLPIEDTVSGIVVSNAGGIVPDPSVQLINPATNAVIATTTSPLTVPKAIGIPAPDQGGFEIDDVPHGNYLMKISAPPSNGCGTEAYIPTQSSVTVALGTNLILTGVQSPTLNQAPSFNVITLEASASSLPAQVGGVAVTVTDTATGAATTCDSPAPPNGTGATPTDLTFPSLVAGHAYQATFTLTPTITAPAVTFTAALNNASINTVVLSGPVLPSSANGIIQVTLEYPYRTAPAPTATPPVAGGTLDCPVDTTGTTSQLNGTTFTVCPGVSSANLPTVQMTATVGYNFPNPGQATSPIQQTFTAAPVGNGAWQLQAPGLLPSTVTFTISDPTGVFQQFSKTDNTSDPGFANQTLLLSATPAPAPIVTVSPASGVTVTTSTPISGLSLSEANGQVVWNDDASASPGSVEPGVYDLTFTESGFDAAATTVTVPLQGVQCPAGGCLATPVSVTLTPHVELDVTPGFTPIAGLAYPTVELTDNGTPVDGIPVNPANAPPASPVPLSAIAPTAVFRDLSVDPGNAYVVTIRAPGYQTCVEPLTLDAGASSPPSCGSVDFSTPTAGGTVDIDNPALVEEGYITGTLAGLINTATSPLSGISLQATLQPGPTCASAASLTGTTDINGNFLLTGDQSTADGGLCVGSIYKVQPTGGTPPNGYLSGSTITGPIVAGNNVENLTLTAGVITEIIKVVDDQGVAIPNASVVAASAIGIQTGVQNGTNPTPPAITDVNGQATVSISPTTYTFTVTAAGHTPTTVGPLPFAPGNDTNQTLTITLTLDRNTIQGLVQLRTGGGGLQTVTGTAVEVSLANPSSPDSPLATVTTSNGTYSFSAEPLSSNQLTYIPDGNYIIEVNLPGQTGVPGYSSSPQDFATANSSSTPTVENSVLQADPATVNVSVSSTVPGTNLGGSKVSLTPTTDVPGTGACGTGQNPQLLLAQQGVAQTATLVGSTVSFVNVVPDDYTLTVSGPNLPTETSTIAACPGTTSSPSISVNQGSVSGTVSVVNAIQNNVNLLDLTVNVGTTAATVTCNSLTSCTYSALVTLGGTYTVQASLTGYQGPATPPSANPNTTTPTVTGVNLTMTPISENVAVAVTSDAGALPLPGATVTLTAPSSGTVFTATGKTDANGNAEVDGVPPNPGAAYNVKAELDETFNGSTVKIVATGTVTVGTVTGTTTPPPDVPATATAQFGELTGSFTVDPVTISYCANSDDACSSPVYGQSLTTAQTYRAYLAPGSYFVGIDATASGYGAVQAVSTTVADGNTGGAGLPTLTHASHNVVVLFHSGGATPLPVPSDATATLSLGGASHAGVADANIPGAFDFSGVAPNAAAYTATASFDTVTVSGSVTVPIQKADPATQTVGGQFALVGGTVTVSPAPGASTPVSVELCSSAACTTKVAPDQVANVDAAGDPATYSAYVPATATATDDLVFSATGYTTPAATAITVSDGQTVSVALVTLQMPPPPPPPTTTTTTASPPTT